MSELFGGGECCGACGVRIEVDEGVQFWLESGDAHELGIEEFNGRDLFGADQCRNFGDRRVMERRHCGFFESKCRRRRASSLSRKGWAWMTLHLSTASATA